nr:hypothetical protein [Shewanella shenzhenensis]
MDVVARTILWRNLTLGLALAGSALSLTPATAADNSQLRKTYLAAREALDKGQHGQYDKLRAQLGDYPLNIYLDFH